MPPPDPSRTRVRRRHPIQRTLGLPLSLALLAAEAPASAAPAETPGSTKVPETPDPRIARANHYIAQADAKSVLGEDAEAAQLYITAFEQLTNTVGHRAPRSLVMAKIVGALRQAADTAVDPETSWAHLCLLQARINDFIADLKAAYGPSSESLPELQTAYEQMTAITTKLRGFGDPQVLCASGSADRGVPKDPEDVEVPEEVSEDPPPIPAPEPPKTNHPGRGLTIAGSLSLTLGVAAGGIMGSALYTSREHRNLVTNLIDTVQAEQRPATPAEYDSVAQWIAKGFRANRIALASGLTGGVALIAGVTMIAIGRRRHRLSRFALTPTLQPSSAGLRLSGRF